MISTSRVVTPLTARSKLTDSKSRINRLLRATALPRAFGALASIGLLALLCAAIAIAHRAYPACRPTLTFFLIPIAFATSVLGTRGGIVVTVISLVAARYLMVATNSSGWQLDISDIVDFSGLAIGSIIISIVVGRLRHTLSDVRRMHKTIIEADKKLIESEELRIAAHREILLAVTGSRLVVCDPQEIRELVRGEKVLEYNIESARDISETRVAFKRKIQELGLISERLHDFEACTTEAATNALKHAGCGTAELYIHGKDVLALIWDKGTGIAPVDLARAALEKGYSTRVSLGMGFKIMWEMADRLAICTSEKGTIILIAINEHVSNDFEHSILSRFPTRELHELV